MKAGSLSRIGGQQTYRPETKDLNLEKLKHARNLVTSEAAKRSVMANRLSKGVFGINQSDLNDNSLFEKIDRTIPISYAPTDISVGVPKSQSRFSELSLR